MGTNRQFGTIRKLPSGRYQVRYRRLGRLVSAERTFATKADANLYLSQVESDLHRGTFVDPSVGRVNFAEFAEAWMADRKLRPRTRDTYTSQLCYLTDEFGLATLAEISAIDVRAWHGRMNRGGLHANTVSKIYRLMRAIMASARGPLRSSLAGAAQHHAGRSRWRGQPERYSSGSGRLKV
ncbi:MAG TPA: hypothetical protein VNQ73_13405 [Ilumatobacter sp.]|nr:hypothetical protein [Ilumatobacter sp.]